MSSGRSKLEDFDVLSRLGSGSFGTVYKVKRLVDNGLYVIKNVRIAELSYKEQSEAINEVQILAQMKSPYVVRYYDSFIEKDSLHIVMEFCNRGDLQNLLKKAKEKNVSCLKEGVIWNILLQVMMGLMYLHKKNILHRDLKSANVFLMKDESRSNYLVKIGDLGVAKLMDTSTALANTIVGTPYYLSPELCADKPYRDKSDCWALGVLIYECCTLRHPFEARNQCALIMKIIEAQYKPPSTSNVSSGLIKLISWLLQKDPNRRPSVKDIFCEDLIQKLLRENQFELPNECEGQPVTTHLSHTESPKKRPGSSRPGSARPTSSSASSSSHILVEDTPLSAVAERSKPSDVAVPKRRPSGTSNIVSEKETPSTENERISRDAAADAKGLNAVSGVAITSSGSSNDADGNGDENRDRNRPPRGDPAPNLRRPSDADTSSAAVAASGNEGRRSSRSGSASGNSASPQVGSVSALSSATTTTSGAVVSSSTRIVRGSSSPSVAVAAAVKAAANTGNIVRGDRVRGGPAGKRVLSENARNRHQVRRERAAGGMGTEAGTAASSSAYSDIKGGPTAAGDDLENNNRVPSSSNPQDDGSEDDSRRRRNKNGHIEKGVALGMEADAVESEGDNIDVPDEELLSMSMQRRRRQSLGDNDDNNNGSSSNDIRRGGSAAAAATAGADMLNADAKKRVGKDPVSYAKHSSTGTREQPSAAVAAGRGAAGFNGYGEDEFEVYSGAEDEEVVAADAVPRVVVGGAVSGRERESRMRRPSFKEEDERRFESAKRSDSSISASDDNAGGARRKRGAAGGGRGNNETLIKNGDVPDADMWDPVWSKTSGHHAHGKDFGRDVDGSGENRGDGSERSAKDAFTNAVTDRFSSMEVTADVYQAQGEGRSSRSSRTPRSESNLNRTEEERADGGSARSVSRREGGKGGRASDEVGYGSEEVGDEGDAHDDDDDDEDDEDSIDEEDQIQSLAELIEEARSKALKILGENLYIKVYQLCARHMGEEAVREEEHAAGGSAGSSGAGDDDDDDDIAEIKLYSDTNSFIKELERTLCDHADTEVACEAVFGVKVLLALESRHQRLVESFKRKRGT